MLKRGWVVILILLSGLLTYNSAFSAQRMVVCEQFANVYCHNSLKAEAYMDSLKQLHPNLFTNIRYHLAPYDPFHDVIPEELDAKKDYYVVGFLPEMAIDGDRAGPEYSNWGEAIYDEATIPSPLEMSIGGYYIPTDRRGVIFVNISPVDQIPSGDYYMRAMVFRDSAYFEDAYDLDWHNNTVFAFLPSTMGESVEFDKSGDIGFMETFSIPDDYDENQVGFTAFVQENETKEVLQGSRIYLKDLDIGLARIEMEEIPNLTTIPPEGGYIQWRGYVSNLTYDSLTCNVWTKAEHLDEDEWYEVKTYNIQLGPNESRKYLNLRQWIPGIAPAGDYKFYAFIGTYPDTAYSWDAIDFSKEEGSKRYGGDLSAPKNFNLVSAYPNPFNKSINITYTLKKTAKVELDIYDITGRKVAELINKYQKEGTNSITWSGITDNGLAVASGIYFCRLKINDEVTAIKIVLQK